MSKRPAGYIVSGRGSENQVHTFCLEHPAILFERAGIPVEVLIGPKLRRIDEDGSHSNVAALTRGLHQRTMSGVQRAHRRDKPDVPPFSLTQIVQSGSNFCNAGNNLHRNAYALRGWRSDARAKALARIRGQMIAFRVAGKRSVSTSLR